MLAATDAESLTFAEEAKRANARVEHSRLEVRRLIEIDARPTELAKLQELEAAWKDLVSVDARLLELAVANTNLKASRLSSGEAATAVNQLVDALTALDHQCPEHPRIEGVSMRARPPQGAIKTSSVLMFH